VLPIERLVFHRETNDAGRSAIGRALLTDNCDAIIHLGDLLGAVGSEKDWARFDRDYPPEVLTEKPFHVCRGNHDCGGFLMGSPREFNRRYPETLGQLREVDVDCVRVILLDTNHQAVSSTQWQQQVLAYQVALDRVDDDSAIRHVLVCGHHPPLSNGRWHPPSQPVFEAFVSPFLKCSKSRAFFSGHVHGYERFEIRGRAFVVSGGGGGPRFPHLHGSHQRRPSEVDLGDPHPLHYVELSATPEAISAHVRGLDESAGNWIELDNWTTQSE
jgi:predicted phosphodiesterase